MSLPLKNVKVLDFTTLLPGPFATWVLADMGAEVLRVESPHREDMLRFLPPSDGKNSATYRMLNRNKRGMALDLKNPASRPVIERLLAQTDILIEQFRPGVMDALGLSYEQLSKQHPQLIYCSITGYGQTGPLKHRAGHDINYLALSGLHSYSGSPSEGPRPAGYQLADVGGGSMFSLTGILAALYQRTQTGQGQHLDVAMLDCVTSFNMIQAGQLLCGGNSPTYEDGMLNGGSFYNNYRTLDGRWLAIGSLEPKFYKKLAQGLECPELLKMKDQAQVIQTVKEIVAQKTLAQWMEIFEPLDACVEPVLNLQEALEHPHLKTRQMVVEVPKDEHTSELQLAHPIKSSAYQPEYRSTGPDCGQHNEEVLTELKFSAQEIAELKQQGALG